MLAPVRAVDLPGCRRAARDPMRDRRSDRVGPLWADEPTIRIVGPVVVAGNDLWGGARQGGYLAVNAEAEGSLNTLCMVSQSPPETGAQDHCTVAPSTSPSRPSRTSNRYSE